MKTFSTACCFFSLVLVVLACTACAPGWQLGKPGPAGGLVFYDKGNDEGGWRWLEAAPADHPVPVPWGGLKLDVAGTATGLGSGPGNTRTILAALGSQLCAASVCDAYELNGYDDWFLPSRDELDLAYRNLHRENLGHFDGGAGYWTSSQHDPGQAWEEFFANGHQYDNGLKSHGLKVRPVRRF